MARFVCDILCVDTVLGTLERNRRHFCMSQSSGTAQSVGWQAQSAGKPAPEDVTAVPLSSAGRSHGQCSHSARCVGDCAGLSLSLTMAEHRRRAADTKEQCPYTCFGCSRNSQQQQIPVTTPWAVPSASSFPQSRRKQQVLLGCPLSCWEHQSPD